MARCRDQTNQHEGEDGKKGHRRRRCPAGVVSPGVFFNYKRASLFGSLSFRFGELIKLYFHLGYLLNYRTQCYETFMSRNLRMFVISQSILSLAGLSRLV